MKPITVMVTASGAPGTAALLRSLRENGERELRLVGTDMSERSVGRHLCDAFHLVPGGADPAFPDAMLEVAEREQVDAILPQSSFDLEGLSEHVDRFPMPVLVSGPAAIRRSNDKAETYELLASARRSGTRVPPRQRRACSRRGGARARLSRARCVLQARVLVGLARLPHPRPDRRPCPPAAARAPGIGVDAARGGGRAATGYRWPRPPRDGARDRRRAHDRRHRQRSRDRARPSEDARGDARGARDVLRDARRRRAHGDRQPHRRGARDRALLQHPARRRAW